MNIGTVYVITAFVSLVQIIMILNRTLATKYKEEVDYPFCKVLNVFVFFCLIDMCWGIFFSKNLLVSQIGFLIISYGFHTMGGIAAYVWLGYAIHYVKATKREKYVLNGVRLFLLSTQIVFIYFNIIDHDAFFVDATGNYSTGSLRVFLYLFQFTYYVIAILFGLYKIYTKKKRDRLYRNVIIFSLIPLIFGIGQYIFYDAAMYSLGFMFSAFVIYSFNVSSQREDYLEKEAERLSIAVYIDAFTGLYNRRAYEEDMEVLDADENKSVYVSMDINGLKDVNDNLGHEAGDELIKNAALIMSDCMGKYGKLYRVGGDEFIAILNIVPELMENLMKDFDSAINDFCGVLVKSMNISWGYVTYMENPGISIKEVAKIADKRMYQKKEQFYARKGVDRRGQQQAFNAVCKSYTKILKVDLMTGHFSIIQMDFLERSTKKGYSENFYDWLQQFVDLGLVHEQDIEYYREHTGKEYLIDYFERERRLYCIYYRRMIENEYKLAMLEIAPAPEYSEKERVVFVYVKNIDR